jgi:hypothetical protein
MASPPAIDFPSYILGGRPGLSEFIEAKPDLGARVLTDLSVEEGGTIVAIGQRASSGTFQLDVYLYGCSRSTCLLIASVHKVSADPRTKPSALFQLSLTPDKRHLELRSSDGRLVLSTLLE